MSSLLFAAVLSLAPVQAAPGVEAPPPPLVIQTLSPGVHVVIGDAGNIAVLSGPDGVLLVDAELPQGAPRVLEAVKTVSDAPLRYVIDSHWHIDHTGGNAALTTAGAVVIGHDAVRARRSTDQFMKAYGATVPAARLPQSLPVVTFNDTLTLHLNGQTVRATHMAGAHTDGDVVVHFVEADVVHMGDIFFNGIFPFIDVGSGGGVDGLIRAVDQVIAASDAATRIVPAHGPVADRATLIAYRDMLTDVRDKVRAGMARGQTLDAIRASRPAAAYALEGDADAFVGFIHESLTLQPALGGSSK